MFDGPCELNSFWRAACVSLPVRCDSLPFLRVSGQGRFCTGGLTPYRSPENQALWQEWRETDVREQWIGSGSNVISTGGEGILDILSEAKVDKRVVWIVQERSVVNLKQIGSTSADVIVEFQWIIVRIRCSNSVCGNFIVATGGCIDLISLIGLESQIQLGGVVQINEVERSISTSIHRVKRLG